MPDMINKTLIEKITDAYLIGGDIYGWSWIY